MAEGSGRVTGHAGPGVQVRPEGLAVGAVDATHAKHGVRAVRGGHDLHGGRRTVERAGGRGLEVGQRSGGPDDRAAVGQRRACRVKPTTATWLVARGGGGR